MKLYATTTSERASKGQGGNEYLEVSITNSEQEIIAYMRIVPNRGYADIAISVEHEPVYSGKIALPTKVMYPPEKMKSKGKQKKDEFTKISHTQQHILNHIHDEDCIWCRRDNGSKE